MNNIYYDIESLENTFMLASYIEYKNHLDFYYLSDFIISKTLEKKIKTKVYAKNKNFKGTISLKNLKEIEPNIELAETFGLSTVDNTNNRYQCPYYNYNKNFYLIRKTDVEYQEDMPYLIGYNSKSYDTTILAYYLSEVFYFQSNGMQKPTLKFKPPTPQQIRELNDKMFTKEYKSYMPNVLLSDGNGGVNFENIAYLVRKSMIYSDRHLDLMAILAQRIALKRCLGQLGRQILTSELIKNDTKIKKEQDMLDLFAYNASDVINLKYILEHPIVKSNLVVKQTLEEDYPEIVYEKKENEYKPNISPTTVKKKRLIADDTSAKFATDIIAPYHRLKDIPYVSYMYPHIDKCKKGQKPQNILELCKKFFYDNIKNANARKEFDRIYNLYKQLEYRDSNNDEEDDYKDKIIVGDNPPDVIIPINEFQIKQLFDCNTNLFYYDREGNITDAYMTFGAGGGHGCGIDLKWLNSEKSFIEDFNQAIKQIEQITAKVAYKQKNIILKNGETLPISHFIERKRNIKTNQYEYIIKDKKIFNYLDTQNKMKHGYTTANIINHNDYSSYYPTLLIMMKAFYNDMLQYDRLEEMYIKKETLGKQMKAPNLSEYERTYLKNSRNGVKLGMNSPTGNADVKKYVTNIKMNNTILSMRILGQLFIWMMAQMLTFEGSCVVSTNTDGLHNILDETTNNKIVQQFVDLTGLIIEPEILGVINKDSNNRIEFEPNTYKIISTGGGDTSAYNGPIINKSLDHPAIIDRILVDYMIEIFKHYGQSGFSKPFNFELAKNCLKKYMDHTDKTKLLIMFQNIIVKSGTSESYPYLRHKDDHDEYKLIDMANRVYIVKEKSEYNLFKASYKKINDKYLEKNIGPDRKILHDPIAKEILNKYQAQAPSDQHKATLEKAKGIDEDWLIYIDNNSIYDMTEKQKDDILTILDLDAYIQMIYRTYEDPKEKVKKWRNMTDYERKF